MLDVLLEFDIADTRLASNVTHVTSIIEMSNAPIEIRAEY